MKYATLTLTLALLLAMPAVAQQSTEVAVLVSAAQDRAEAEQVMSRAAVADPVLVIELDAATYAALVDAIAGLYGYQAEVDDPDNPGQTIPNPQSKADFMQAFLAQQIGRWIASHGVQEHRRANPEPQYTLKQKRQRQQP